MIQYIVEVEKLGYAMTILTALNGRVKGSSDSATRTAVNRI
jgi:hypothetical protein